MSARLPFFPIAVIALLAAGSAWGAKLTADTLAPGDLFPAQAGKALSYPLGFEVAYFPQPQSHQWKLYEKSADAAPDDGAAPAGIMVPTSEGLAATSEESAFSSQVDRLRPTIVSIEFTSSPAEAQRMVEEFLTEKRQIEKLNAVDDGQEKPADDSGDKPADDTVKEDKPYVPPIVVYKLAADPKFGGAVIYGREFDLGRAGGMRRATAVVAAKGSVFLKVDARKGLADTVYDGDERNLEQRARAIATYLLSQF